MYIFPTICPLLLLEEEVFVLLVRKRMGFLRLVMLVSPLVASGYIYECASVANKMRVQMRTVSISSRVMAFCVGNGGMVGALPALA